MGRHRDRLRIARGLAVLLAGAISTVAAQQAGVAARPLIFDGVTVVDVEQGKLVPGQRVVIAGNRITAMGNPGRTGMPNGGQVVDARGKYLIPGLWNMHTHTQRDYYDLLLIAAGVTGVRNAGSGLPIDQQRRRWGEVLAGTRVGPPRQVLAGMPFPETRLRDSVIVEQMVDSLKTYGANSVKMMPYSHTVAAAARRAGLPFGGHMPYLFGFVGPVPLADAEASDSGMNFFDHWVGADTATYFRCLDGKRTGRVASAEGCRPIAERFRHNGSWWVPTTFAMTNFLPTGVIEREILARLGALARAFWDGTPVHGNWLHDSAGNGPPTDSLGYMAIPRQAGMPILAGIDHSDRQKPPGFYLHAELALYVAQGLTPLMALQAATINPAKLLHGTDSLGTVAPGKLADLVLLDANPLADITNTTAIRAVVANGRYFDRAALDKLMIDARSMW